MLAVGLITAWASGGSGEADAGSDYGFRGEHLALRVPHQGAWFDVQLDMVVDGHARAADIEQAKRDLVGRFPGAVVSGEEETTSVAVSQYVLSGFWWPTHTTSWRYNPAGKPSALSADASALSGAAGAWGSVGASWSFSGGSTTSLGTGACSGGGTDGTNTVGWRQQSGSVLAVTCTWYRTGTTPATATEFDMELSPSWSWTTGTTSIGIDLQSVATHEFGHALGLSHAPSSAAVMYYAYTSGTLKRIPQPDDIAGVLAIYGGSVATPTATNTATRTPTAAAPTNTPTRTPTVAPTSTRTPTPTATPSSGWSWGRGGKKRATPTPTLASPALDGASPTPTEKHPPRRTWGAWWGAIFGDVLR